MEFTLLVESYGLGLSLCTKMFCRLFKNVFGRHESYFGASNSPILLFKGGMHVRSIDLHSLRFPSGSILTNLLMASMHFPAVSILETCNKPCNKI